MLERVRTEKDRAHITRVVIPEDCNLAPSYRWPVVMLLHIIVRGHYVSRLLRLALASNLVLGHGW